MKRKILFTSMATVALAIGVSTAASAANYLPFGVQNNVLTSTVTGGGWTECFSQTYGAGGQSISSILAGCSAGTNLMMAARETGSDTLLLLAQAPTADVTFETGTGNTTHNANGVEWYFNDSYSWGFAKGGDIVSRGSCDTQASSFGGGANGAQRLCWHTGGGQMNGGWRAGVSDSLNSSSDFEKVLFTSNGGGVVPEPATWAMMIIGFGAAGSMIRRRNAAVA